MAENAYIVVYNQTSVNVIAPTARAAVNQLDRSGYIPAGAEVYVKRAGARRSVRFRKAGSGGWKEV